jgi:hypothetical protein
MNTVELDQFQPVPAIQNHEVLRPNPDLTYFQHLNYSDDRYGNAIRHEIQQKWVQLNQGKSPDPIKNERGYKRIAQQVHAKFQQLHREHRARTLLWMQSERTLNLLRTKGLTPNPTQDQVDEAMLRFVQRLDLSRFPEIEESLPQLGPNQYFELSRPQLVADWGYPFYSTVVEGTRQKRIIGLNSDWWAAFLGGDHRLGHDVIYFVPESRFYFLDVVLGCYVPTSEGKVLLWASQSLQSRAWGQEASVATTILVNFRTKKVMDEIISKAKAVLAAESGFFNGPDARPRWKDTRQNDQVESIIATFVKDEVEPAEGQILPLGECLLQLGEKGELALSRKEKTEKINDAIRDLFDKGLRNDLKLADGRGVKGWHGLRLRVSSGSIMECDAEESIVREPGQSEQQNEQTKELALAT